MNTPGATVNRGEIVSMYAGLKRGACRVGPRLFLLGTLQMWHEKTDLY